MAEPKDHERKAAAARIAQQQTWVDLQVQQAIERGEFDDLPGAGRPIADLGTEHDPDWWVKQLVEREQVTGVLPPALALRRDDAELDDRLDELAVERDVRVAVKEFNDRVIRARYTPVDGPPLITMPRDVQETLDQWRARRAARSAAARAEARRRDAERLEGEQARSRARLLRWWQGGRSHDRSTRPDSNRSERS